MEQDRRDTMPDGHRKQRSHAGAVVSRRVVQRVGRVRAFITFTALSATAAEAYVLVASFWVWGAISIRAAATGWPPGRT